MKKYIFIWILTVFAFFVFADAKEELKKIIDNANTGEFTKANKHIDELQEQGKQYVSQGKYEKALECYKKALAQADSLYGKGSTASGMIYTSMGSLFLKKGDKLKAADSLVKASEIYKKSLGGMLKPNNYYILRLQAATIYCNSKKYATALGILKELEKEIKQLPMERRAKIYYLLAECFYAENKFTKTIKYCEIADKEIPADINADDFFAKNYDIWASCLTSLEKRKEAIDKLEKCIKYAIKAKKNNIFMGQAFLNAGTNYVYLEDYSNARKYLDKALKCFENIKKDSLYWKGITYLLIARNARFARKWKEAEKYYEQTVELLEKYLAVLGKSESIPESKPFRDTAFEALCISYKWLQRCFCVNQTQAKALAIYEKTKRLKIDYPNSILVADIYPGLVSNFMDLEKYEDSLKLADEAINLYSSMKLSPEEQDQVATLWWLKANIFQLTGKSEKAVQAGKKAYVEFAKNHTENSHYLKKISSCLKDWKSNSKTEK